MPFIKSQPLNDWNLMFERIYDRTQNYAKNEYEIHSHLTEVTGAFGKLAFKNKNFDAAQTFLPKMFVWATALFRKMRVEGLDLQDAIFVKYPHVCTYCTKAPCNCPKGAKPEIRLDDLRDIKFRNQPKQDFSLNGIQLMFKEIYGGTWLTSPEHDPGVIDADIRKIFTRLIEELAETAEALRFHHLYPSNFGNELSDYFAWWFALVSCFNQFRPDQPELLAEDIVWNSYPGRCVECGLIPCDCRAAPVREILSKPALNHLAEIDGLTQADNRTSFNREIAEIMSEHYPVGLPFSCIVIDVDNLKTLNDRYSHSFGDSALKAVANAIRQKARSRDRLFRWGGDEFLVLCPDLTAAEAAGMMTRVASTLEGKPLKGTDLNGTSAEWVVTLTVGIVECFTVDKIKEGIELGFKLAEKSKQAGKGQIHCCPR